MKALVITQKLDKEDWLLGFFHRWVEEMGKRLERIYTIALEEGKMRNGRGHNRIRSLINFNLTLAKVLSEGKIDIILVHMCPQYVILSWPYATLKNIPIVLWYAHGSASLYLRLAHLLADKVISSSRDGFRLKSDKTVFTGQGIDVEKFKIQNPKSKIENKEKVILSVGRISPIKDYETLIEAADILVNRKNINNLKFQIVGGIPSKSQKRYLDSLKDRVSSYKLDRCFQFVGPIPYTQIDRYYQDCSVFISTSNTGSLDKTVLEAMACGKIVFTCNEAFRDILDKRLMFKKRDAAELAQKINSGLQEDEKLRADLRDIVLKGHSLGTLVDKFIDIFQNLIN